MSAAGSFGLAASLRCLPFYGLMEPNNSPWPFDVLGTRNALAVPLALPASRFMVPGSRSFGYLVLSWALVVGLFTLVLLPLGRRMFQWAMAVVAVGSSSLPVLALLELFARPPYGDGPPLSFSWGAVVAVGAAFVAALAAWAPVVAYVRQPHARPTVGDRVWAQWVGLAIRHRHADVVRG